MSHLSEEDLVLYYYSEDAALSLTAEQHLADCPECRAQYNSLRLVLNTVDSAAVPDRGADYGERVWRRIQGRVGRRRWWMFVPVAAMLLGVAFFAGRLTQPAATTNAGQVRERILLVAVGDHLDRSLLVLAELSHAPDAPSGKVDISNERQLAGELLDDNRLYRQTAHATGDNAVASALDDLERVLIEVANSPAEISQEQLARIRQEIADRGLLFEVRVIGSRVRRRENGRKL
jgi:hypothetical protein